VQFSGVAYPDAFIALLKDGVEIGRKNANSAGAFDFSVTNLAAGSYQFGFLAQDASGVRSIAFTVGLTLTAGQTTTMTGIILPPTMDITNPVVTAGDKVQVTGASAPGAAVRLVVDAGKYTFTVPSLLDGSWKYQVPTQGLANGLYTVKAQTVIGPDMSSGFSQALQFGVGVQIPVSQCQNAPDINGNGRVNLVDFSILAYWWRRPIPPGATFDLNCDGVVNLADFSILAYYWNG
jgi:hypothetical protein